MNNSDWARVHSFVTVQEQMRELTIIEIRDLKKRLAAKEKFLAELNAEAEEEVLTRTKSKKR